MVQGELSTELGHTLVLQVGALVWLVRPSQGEFAYDTMRGPGHCIPAQDSEKFKNSKFKCGFLVNYGGVFVDIDQ